VNVPPGLIEVRELTKRFNDKVAVNRLSFNVEPGRVTGFLGPNGAGKSTTMRLICGLDRATGGSATIGGTAYQDLKRPLLTVGALLEARALHPGRSAHNHLLYLAQTQGLPARRADEVVDLVGLHEVRNKRVGGFSLGMTQRLGMAAAMLGNPKVLLLDEPGNGLDPEGIRWVRTFVRQLASEGRTVFISSHLMSEMSVTADYLIVIGRGQLIADCATGEFIQRSSERSVLVRTTDPARLRDLITNEGGEVKEDDGPDDTATAGDVPAFVVTGLPAPRIGELAASAQIVLHELTPQLPSLEEAFMELTAGSVEYGDSTHGPAAQATPAERSMS
jgi:ABC-2 type transport system ATP-binding protein